MNCNPNIQARNNQFISTCLRIIARRRNLDMRSAVKLALATKPQCYYVNYEQAQAAVRRICSGHTHRVMVRKPNKTNIEQWQEIYERAQAYMKRTHNQNLDSAIYHVISTLRPSRYFISEDRAIRLMRPFITNATQVKLK